jgi:hypothetical protein
MVDFVLVLSIRALLAVPSRVVRGVGLNLFARATPGLREAGWQVGFVGVRVSRTIAALTVGGGRGLDKDTPPCIAIEPGCTLTIHEWRWGFGLELL